MNELGCKLKLNVSKAGGRTSQLEVNYWGQSTTTSTMEIKIQEGLTGSCDDCSLKDQL